MKTKLLKRKMKKIKLPRKLKKAVSYSYILHTHRQYTKAVRRLLDFTTRAHKTLQWLRLEDLAKRCNQSPYRLYKSLGSSVSLDDLLAWEQMNALLPPHRRSWKLVKEMKGE